jgi:hypothetical protein
VTVRSGRWYVDPVLVVSKPDPAADTERHAGPDATQPVGVADTVNATTLTHAGTVTVRAGADALAAGTRLGHFRIERKLGAGGMGEVYLATDLALDRPVAIKVLLPGIGSATARERMIREARAQARVQHPNVAHIYFIDEEQGRLYFAMEYLSGTTLADQIAKGPIPVEEALQLVRGAALGLREAQRSGFTHRDVKPSNLMVDGHGVVKVLDFGLAAAAPGTAGDGPVEQTTLAGTPLYMAPEQGRGDPIDLRADIYALGATLFHLVSGKPPFQSDSVEKLVTLHASAQRPALPRGANPRTAIVAIDALITRMMAVRPEDRFASYDELLRAIELASLQHTRPAGLWVRTMATFVDLALGAVVVALSRLLILGRDGDVQMGKLGYLIGLVYASVTIARWGKTAGKALFELEVVSVATGHRPSWGQAIRREVALGGLPLVMGWGAYASEYLGYSESRSVFGILGAASVAILALLLIHASLRVPGKRTVWDRLSGTMVRYSALRRQ